MAPRVWVRSCGPTSLAAAGCRGARGEDRNCQAPRPSSDRAHVELDVLGVEIVMVDSDVVAGAMSHRAGARSRLAGVPGRAHELTSITASSNPLQVSRAAWPLEPSRSMLVELTNAKGNVDMANKAVTPVGLNHTGLNVRN